MPERKSTLIRWAGNDDLQLVVLLAVDKIIRTSHNKAYDIWDKVAPLLRSAGVELTPGSIQQQLAKLHIRMKKDYRLKEDEPLATLFAIVRNNTRDKGTVKKSHAHANEMVDPDQDPSNQEEATPTNFCNSSKVKKTILKRKPLPYKPIRPKPATKPTPNMEQIIPPRRQTHARAARKQLNYSYTEADSAITDSDATVTDTVAIKHEPESPTRLVVQLPVRPTGSNVQVNTANQQLAPANNALPNTEIGMGFPVGASTTITNDTFTNGTFGQSLAAGASTATTNNAFANSNNFHGFPLNASPTVNNNAFDNSNLGQGFSVVNASTAINNNSASTDYNQVDVAAHYGFGPINTGNVLPPPSASTDYLANGFGPAMPSNTYGTIQSNTSASYDAAQIGLAPTNLSALGLQQPRPVEAHIQLPLQPGQTVAQFEMVEAAPTMPFYHMYAPDYAEDSHCPSTLGLPGMGYTGGARMPNNTSNNQSSDDKTVSPASSKFGSSEVPVHSAMQTTLNTAGGGHTGGLNLLNSDVDNTVSNHEATSAASADFGTSDTPAHLAVQTTNLGDAFGFMHYEGDVNYISPASTWSAFTPDTAYTDSAIGMTTTPALHGYGTALPGFDNVIPGFDTALPGYNNLFQLPEEHQHMLISQAAVDDSKGLPAENGGEGVDNADIVAEIVGEMMEWAMTNANA